MHADEALVAPGLQRLVDVIAPGVGGAVDAAQRLSGGASQQTWAFDINGPSGRVPLILRRAPDRAGERSRMTAGLDVEARLIAAAKAAARRVLARQCGEALARIHAMPTADLPNTLRRSGPRAELQWQMDQHRSHDTARPVFELAFQWLRQHVPAEVPKPVLVHGDFRNGNLMVGEGGLVGVLDWELAHLGDPMEDLGWLCVNAWRFGCVDLPVGGFGTRDDLFEGYAAAGGQVDEPRVHYWEVQGTLKWGIVCEAMAHAWLAGHERDVEKAAIGRRASESEIDLLALLAPR